MKKLLSAVLSLALAATSFVTVFAGNEPDITVSVSELTTEKYEAVMMDTLPDGTTPYQISVGFKNLPDLTWARSGGGVRLGSFAVKLFTDITKVSKIQGMNVDQQTEDWGADLYGYLKVANDNIALNSLDNSISIVKAVTAAGDAFPYVTADATKDVDGKLDDAIVFYIAIKEPITITKTNAQITINNGGMGSDKETLTTVQNDNLDIAIGKTTPPAPSEKAAVAGKAIEDGFKTFSTDAAIEFAVDATPTIEISKSGTTDKLTETLGSGVIGEGKTKIIPIVSYKIGRHGVAAGDIFTIKVTNGTDTSSWTYTVPAE